MIHSGPGSNKRRWVWTVLFVLLATISMVGPTQAVSNLVNASVKVMAELTKVLGGEVARQAASTRAAAASAAASQVSSGPQIPLERAAELMGWSEFLPVEASAEAETAVSAAGPANANAGAAGVALPNAGPRRFQGGPGFGGVGVGSPSGFDAAIPGGAIDLPEPLAETESVTESAADSSSELIAAILDGPTGGQFAGGGEVPGLSVAEALAASPATQGDLPAAAADAAPADVPPGAPPFVQGETPGGPRGAAPPSNQGGPPGLGAGIPNQVPPTIAAVPNGVGGASSAGPNVAQVPEPSGLMLLSLGVAALVRHRRRR